MRAAPRPTSVVLWPDWPSLDPEPAGLAARAWDAAGVRDSPIALYRQVIPNWTDAEPAFRNRFERAKLRLAALEQR